MVENTGWTTGKNNKNQTEWIPPDLDTRQHRINGYRPSERYLLPDDEPPDGDLPEEGRLENDAGTSGDIADP